MLRKEHGSLIGPLQRPEIDTELSQVLLHAVLLSHSSKGMPFAHLIDHPALFPFKVHITVQDLMRSHIFRGQRQGDQSDFIELA